MVIPMLVFSLILMTLNRNLVLCFVLMEVL